MNHITKMLRDWLTPLQGDQTPLWVVGGAVRDHLLSRVPKDIDLMCHDAQVMAEKLAAAKDAAVVPFRKKADEPCFRVADRKSPDSFIDIVPMRGDTVAADLGHRDFTINAIAIRVEQGKNLGDVIDPLNGVRDLEQGLIRMTGPDVFSADPLRILRAVRFAAMLDFTIEEATLAAMRRHFTLIQNTAAERILAELLEIFRTGRSTFFVRLMDDLGILDVIFPEIRAMKGCTQNTYHHTDVWNHSLMVLEICEYVVNHLQEFFGSVTEDVADNLKPGNRIPLLKLSAMLHDVGKPMTRGVKEDTGRITFYGHDKEGAEIVSQITQRLRMSSRDQEFVRTMVAEHLNVLSLFFYKVRPTTRMRWFRKLKDDCIPIIIMGIGDIKSTLGPASTEERREHHLQWSQNMAMTYYGKIKKQLERHNLITGKDQIDMGMSPGPEMGSILRKIREAQDAGLIINREEAMAMVKALENGNCQSQ